MRVPAGATDVITYFKLVDPSTGVPETGLTITDLDLTYTRDQAAAVKNDALAHGAVDDAHTDLECFEVDGTNCPGQYRVDWPDAAFAAGVDKVQLCVNGAAIDPAYIEVGIGATPADMVKISGDAPAADNLEATYDGTGYIDEFAPAFQLQLAGLSGGLSVKQVAESRSVTEGTETNDHEATWTEDAIIYDVTDSESGVGIDYYLQFDIGGADAIPVDCHLHGWFEDPAGDSGESIAVQAYNFFSAVWDTILTLEDGSAEEFHDMVLTVNDVGVVATDPGIVRIRFLASGSAAANVMHINRISVGYVNSLQTDEDGYIILADDGITAARIADDAFSNEHFATGALTADAFAADALVAATFATGAFTADAFAADALVAATFATDSISADALKADAIDLILDEALAGHTGANTLGGAIYTIQGLVQNNIRWSSITYDANNQLTSVVITYYPTAADAENETNAIDAHTLTATYNASGEITAYKVKLN